MAARKKTKGKKAKKKTKKTPLRKKVARKAAKKAAAKTRARAKARKPKAARKKAVRKKAAPKKAARKKAARKSAARAKAKAVMPVTAVSAAPEAPPGERVGVVTHYFTHLGVAIVQLDGASLREGETIHVKGHTSDFRQRVESMEVDHVHVPEAHAGQSIGLRVAQHAREHDVVYKVA